MSLPSAGELLATVETTWPPAGCTTLGPWTVRDGGGGGKRVSSATANAPVTETDLPAAEAAMRGFGQKPLFMIRPGEHELDRMLDGQGYRIVDPVDLFVAPVAPLADRDLPRLAAIEVWPPLAIMREIWAEGGIGPGRVAVMERAPHPKTALLGRRHDRAVAAAFVGMHGAIAMIHAIEVLAAYRRQGVARTMMIGAAHWAEKQGASYLSLVVTTANAGAQALYSSLGFQHVGQYHYRLKDD